MADLDNLELNAAEREEEEKRRRLKQASLDQDIARKYDPARLSKIVVEGAGRGERLDLATRSQMERILPGHDFSKVRVFRGAFAEEITARHKADAVTIANTGMILMRESPRSAPGTTAHQALLAHELTHVAQAQRGMHFALEDGGGHGDQAEGEAQGVERAVAGGELKAPEADGSEQGGAQNEKAKKEHQRRKVMERVMEMIGDRRRQQFERQGGLQR